MVVRVAGQSGGGEFWRRAAEGDHDRGAQGGGDVHGAGVVCQEDAGQFEQSHKFSERGAASEKK
jgi:hypothetical protein